MGFEIERFASSDNLEDFKCGICLEIFENPIMISVCEHVYCRRCIDDWLKTDTSCPEDRTPIQESDLKPPPRMIRNFYDRLRIRCEFADLGCQKVVPLHTLAAHLKECTFNQGVCPRDCGFQGDYQQVKAHDCVKYLKSLLSSNQITQKLGSMTISKADLDKNTLFELCGFSRWFLDLNLRDYNKIKTAIYFYSPLINKMKEICQTRNECFDVEKHVADGRIRMSLVMNNFVAVKPAWSGYYNSVSLILFVDDFACPALMLLLVSTLIEFEKEFINSFFGGKKERFQDLVFTALNSDKFSYLEPKHWVAMSAVLRKPIFFFDIENVNKIGIKDNDHNFRFVGFEEDDVDSVKPICMYYDKSGFIHFYNAILPKNNNPRNFDNVSLWRPKNRPQDYLVLKRRR